MGGVGATVRKPLEGNDCNSVAPTSFPDQGRLNGLDLFSGIGGLAIALAPWVRPLAYVEIEPYCQALLRERGEDGSLPVAPIWDDVCTFNGVPWRGHVDIIYGGFPCQDISVAGRGAGLEGKRSGLFFEIMRLAEEIRPTFVFLENVPAIRGRGAQRVVTELAARGYDTRWGVLSAFDVGAPHKRERWFLLAHRHGNGLEGIAKCDRQESQGGGTPGNDPHRLRDYVPDANGDPLRIVEQRMSGGRASGVRHEGPLVAGKHGAYRDVVDTSRKRLEIWNAVQGTAGEDVHSASRASGWATEPNVGRVAHGVPARVDRLKGLGNAVVPAQAREAFGRLMGFAP